ncbi:MAG: hypothetical protein IPO81_12185 [Kouleothrix sp.]|nr:hypothetical protein [Kouleothrix sp.]
MLTLAFILTLLVALLCLVLSGSVPTRYLGVAAGVALLACGAALLVARARGGLPLELVDQSWIALENYSVEIVLRFDAVSWALALLALVGGGLALLALALGLPPNLRGFGGLFAAALLALLAVVAGLADQSLLFLPFLWATATLLVFLALRASGALSGSDAPLVVLLTGLLGALALLGAALLAPVALPGAVARQATLVCWTAVGLLALGAPPLHAPFQELAEAPAALAGALLALGLPLLGGYALIRFFAGLSVPPGPAWRLTLTLLGLATLLVCAAGAASAGRLRRLIAWQLSAQMGLLLIATGQGGAALRVAGPALLANAAASALACYLAVAILERRAGTDQLSEIKLREPLILPGLVFLAGAAAAAGLPGWSGMWPRRWLVDELLRTAPWAIPPLLAGSALLALTAVAPLASFWRGAAPSPAGDLDAQPRRLSAIGLVAAASAAPLLVFGIAPQLAWAGWLAPAQRALAPAATTAAPALPGLATQLACGLAALALLGLPALLRRGRPAGLATDGVLRPQALGESLRGLSWLGTATRAFAWLWGALLGLSRTSRRGLALLEQRYYLAGLVIAVIVVIMLFIQ